MPDDCFCVTRNVYGDRRLNIVQTAGVIDGSVLVLCLLSIQLTNLAELTEDTKFDWCNSTYTQRDAIGAIVHTHNGMLHHSFTIYE